jgi:GT2 family glycosyltransferase
VITPCYNAAAFVGETLASVAAQRAPTLEHIVVDDGSTDESWAVITAAAAAAHPLGRLRAVRLEANRGGAHARNVGAALARGAYLMFLDADDVLAPGTLAALATAAEAQPHAIAVCAWGRLAWDGERWVETPTEVAFPPPPDPLLGWLGGTYVPPCGVLWPRDVYDRTGGWDEALTVNQDGDLMMRALASGERLSVVPGGPLAWYRTHTDRSVSRPTYTRAWVESQLRVIDKIAVALGPRATTDPYGARIALSYAHLGRLGMLHGHRALAGICFRRSEQYQPDGATPKTWVGRFLHATLGLEGKERIAAMLARLGIGTALRREFLARHRAAERKA